MSKSSLLTLAILQLLSYDIASAQSGHAPLHEDPIVYANNCYFGVQKHFSDAIDTMNNEIRACKRGGTKKKCDTKGIQQMHQALETYRTCLKLH